MASLARPSSSLRGAITLSAIRSESSARTASSISPVSWLSTSSNRAISVDRSCGGAAKNMSVISRSNSRRRSLDGSRARAIRSLILLSVIAVNSGLSAPADRTVGGAVGGQKVVLARAIGCGVGGRRRGDGLAAWNRARHQRRRRRGHIAARPPKNWRGRATGRRPGRRDGRRLAVGAPDLPPGQVRKSVGWLAVVSAAALASACPRALAIGADERDSGGDGGEAGHGGSGRAVSTIGLAWSA